MQLLVCVQKLNILVVTSQQTVTQIKAQVASPEGIVPVDKVVLLVDTPLEDDAVLTQCVVQALSTLEVAGRMLGGEYGWGCTAPEGVVGFKDNQMPKRHCFKVKSWLPVGGHPRSDLGSGL